VLGDGEQFTHFFDADFTYANAALARFYGLSGASTNAVVRVPAGSERGGILTTGAFLAVNGDPDETSPIRRAVRIRERLLCQPIDPPPPGISVSREAAEKALKERWESGQMTNRERYSALTAAPYCQTCHEKRINPLGFGLEDYDTIGRYRSTDLNHLAIDSSGIWYGITKLDGGDVQSFNGARDLSRKLAASDSVQACLVANSFRFAVGTGHQIIDEVNELAGNLSAQELNDYSCAVNDMARNMIANGANAKAMLQSLGSLKLVRYRKEQNR
ncbi:MAG TPA: DUF1588 domain-containing protein, partial [Cellvibrionaceae bacterium]